MSTRNILKNLAILLFVTVAITITSFVSPSAMAANSGDFNPGNIIDDSVFFDGNSLSVTEIQSFLDSKVPVCTINNGQPSHAAGAPYYRSDGSIFTYIASTCLKNYTESTPNMGVQFSANGSQICSQYIGSNEESAAQIISKISRACSISPKVLLVLLEKEQSLISDSWPTVKQLTEATGFECYDNGEPCVGVNAGFFKQVWSAARQFQRYGSGTFTWYPVGQTSNILYQANLPSCGTRSVYIENRATAALYYYTPYTPNQAALSNLYGTGDACSAYGNRNFWRMFTDWFGSTHGGPLTQTQVYARDASGVLWLYTSRDGGVLTNRLLAGNG
ncbi:hypothetical protein M2121_001570, partial [Aurantimicrobium minutum]|nr:hypothetical protein [Aurantimicrobium minutum]